MPVVWFENQFIYHAKLELSDKCRIINAQQQKESIFDTFAGAFT